MVYIIGIGPGGSTDYLTVKALRLLQLVDIAIYPGEMIGNEIKNEIKGKLFVGRYSSKEIENIITNSISANKTVALLEPGDGSLYSGEIGVFKSLSENIKWLKQNNIDYEVVPGISSWFALLAKLGLENVKIGINQTIILNTPSRGAFNISENSIKELAKHKASLVFFMAIELIHEIIEELKIYYPLDTPIIIGYKVSWADEKIIRTTLRNFFIDCNVNEIQRHTIILIGECYEKN